MTDNITFFGNNLGFLFDSATGLFTETPQEMPLPSYEAACGAATAEDGSRMVVVAGNFDFQFGGAQTQVPNCHE